MYGDILNLVHNLSAQICEHFNIPSPRIYVSIMQNRADAAGAMIFKPKISDMYIELIIPYDIALKRDEACLTAIILHEHCHYYDGVQMTQKQRRVSIKEYAKNSYKRKLDEKRTWRGTKNLAKALGLWSQNLFNAIRMCEFASEITY